MRLIDADAFKQYIIDGYEMVADRFTTKELKEEALKVSMEFCKDIDEQPTVDAEEVVRCRDCIHKYERPMFRWNEAYCTCDFTDERYNPNGFCYHGERLGE